MNAVKAIYRVAAAADAIQARAEAIALEQSVELPRAAIRDRRILDDIVAKVGSIEPLEDGAYRVAILLATETTGFEAGQLMNMLFGNVSLQDDVELLDVELPRELLAAFPGPRFGIEGLRNIARADRRALTCSALKPQGLSPDELAKLCYTFARSGIDVIKDDHGLANQSYAPFADRVLACQRAVERANRETGGHSIYAPSLSGGPTMLFEQARMVRDEGVQAVLAAPMIMGVPMFRELVAEHLEVPVLAHPALGGASRISPVLLFGKLFRLFGADAIIYPNHGGRFAYSKQQCSALAAAARAPWGGIRPALPVPAGGMTLERIEEMLAFYGRDTMLLIGGGLLSAGDALLDKSREFVQKVGAS